MGREIAAGFDIYSLRTDFLSQSSFENQSTGIGLRFTHNPRTGQDYVWIEIFGKPDSIAAIVELAQTTARRGVYFHGGKTLPHVPEALLVADPAQV